MDKNDEELIKAIQETPKMVADLIESFKLRAALKEIIGLARKGNNYLSVKEPWHQIKTNKTATGTTLNICIQVVRSLAILLSPFIPNSSKEIWNLLKIQEDLAKTPWDAAAQLAVPVGYSITAPKTLFSKIDGKELTTKLEIIRKNKETQKTAPQMTTMQITHEEFKKSDIRIGKILEVHSIKGADKLIKLIIDIGERKIQCVAGIKQYYKPEELIGKSVAVLTNLQPTKLKGELSEGMILAASEGDSVRILVPDGEIEPGSKVS